MEEYGLVSPVPRLYTARMAYEYDERKSEETLRDRGIDFDFAARLFDGQFIEYEDTRRDYGEERHVAIGAIEKELSRSCIPGEMAVAASSLQDEPTGENVMPSAERSRKRSERIGRVDWRKVRATTDQDIARLIAEDPDAAPGLTEDALDRAVIVAPGGERTPYRERIPRFSELLRPGTRAPQSGQYEIVGPRGQRLGTPRTVAGGHPLPPTPKIGQRYRLVEPSAHKASA